MPQASDLARHQKHRGSPSLMLFEQNQEFGPPRQKNSQGYLPSSLGTIYATRDLSLKAAMLNGAAASGRAKGKRQVSQKTAKSRRSRSYPGIGSGRSCFNYGGKTAHTTFGSTRIPPTSRAVSIAEVRYRTSSPSIPRIKPQRAMHPWPRDRPGGACCSAGQRS